MARTDGKLMWQWRYRTTRNQQTAPAKKTSNAEKCGALFYKGSPTGFATTSRWSYTPR